MSPSVRRASRPAGICATAAPPSAGICDDPRGGRGRSARAAVVGRRVRRDRRRRDPCSRPFLGRVRGSASGERDRTRRDCTRRRRGGDRFGPSIDSSPPSMRRRPVADDRRPPGRRTSDRRLGEDARVGGVPCAIRRARGGIGSWTSRAWPRAIVAEIVRDLLSSPCSCSCSCSWTRSGTFASACDACDASDAFGLSCPSCPACPSSPSCCGCDCGSRTGIANLSERRIGAFGPSCPSCAASPSSPSCCGCDCGSRNGIASLSGRRIGSDPSPSLGLERSAPHLSAELCAGWIRFSQTFAKLAGTTA